MNWTFCGGVVLVSFIILFIICPVTAARSGDSAQPASVDIHASSGLQLGGGSAKHGSEADQTVDGSARISPGAPSGGSNPGVTDRMIEKGIGGASGTGDAPGGFGYAMAGQPGTASGVGAAGAPPGQPALSGSPAIQAGNAISRSDSLSTDPGQSPLHSSPATLENQEPGHFQGGYGYLTAGISLNGHADELSSLEAAVDADEMRGQIRTGSSGRTLATGTQRYGQAPVGAELARSGSNAGPFLDDATGGITSSGTVSSSDTGGGSPDIPGRGPSPRRQQNRPKSLPDQCPCAPAQANHIPASSSPSGQESKDETPSRQRSRKNAPLSVANESPQQATAPPTTGDGRLFFPFGLLPFFGFRRVLKKNVLEYTPRSRIYETIQEQPGIDVITLSEKTGINVNTLRYHLMKLVDTGKITQLSRSGIIRNFVNQGAYAPFEQLIIHYIRTETPAGIIRLLSRYPGLSRQQIADALAISGPSVSRHIQQMTEEGIIGNRSDGRTHHYYLADAVLSVLSVHVPAVFQMVSGKERVPAHAHATP